MASAQKFQGFDAVRGIAALLVFLFHFYSLAGMDNIHVGGEDITWLWKAGFVGLDIFFVLSGFLIFRTVYLHGVNQKYFKRRLLRIAPLYYLSIAVGIFLLQPAIWLEGWKGAWDILSHLFFVQSFAPSTYYGINPVLWSLSIEMIFYLFMPLVFLFSKKNTARIVGIAVVMLVATYLFRAWITQFYDSWNSTEKIIFTENFTGRADHFAFGMLASLASIHFSESTLARRLSPLFLAGGVVGIGLGMLKFAQFGGAFRTVFYAQVFLHSLVALATASFLFGLASAHAAIKKIFGNPVFEFLGLISYSFYVWHLIIIENVLTLKLDLWQSFFFALFATLTLSITTYFLVERSFLRDKKY